MQTPTETQRSKLLQQPNRTSRPIQSHTDRVLAAIRPDDSSRLAALKAEKSLTYLNRGPRPDPGDAETP